MEEHDFPLDEVHIDELLLWPFGEGRIDELYLEVGSPPRGRIRGASSLEYLKPYEILRSEIVQRLVYDILVDDQIVRLESRGALMFHYPSADGRKAFNVHVGIFDGNIEAVFHSVPRR